MHSLPGSQQIRTPSGAKPAEISVVANVAWQVDSPSKRQEGHKSRIFVVEDNAFVRESVVNLISSQSDLLCCGESENLPSTPANVARCKPDLILMDVRFKDGEAFDLINSLTLSTLRPAILVLSRCEEILYAERALQAGARGYVMNVEAADELLTAIRTVLRGCVYLSPAMSARLVQRVLKPGMKTMESEGPGEMPG